MIYNRKSSSMAFDGTESIDSVIVSVSEFVALLNQSLEYVFPSVTVAGEIANFRISKNRWVYFDLKDELSSVRCFGTVYQLPGPLEDGMLLEVRAQPKLHNLYGFSLNITSMRPSGEGTIRRAAELLQAKLAAEGLFDESRKRALPYPPKTIGLITSGESAAYADFTKILQARWGGMAITHVDVQVQGEPAPAQIVAAIERLNGLAEPPEVIVVTRGGGSAEDLQAFSHETVVRAIAASRVPTLVAIGHEIDVSLGELAADRRASTPSNAAELLTPDKRAVLQAVKADRKVLDRAIEDALSFQRQRLDGMSLLLDREVAQVIARQRLSMQARSDLLTALSPEAILRRGYAIVRKENAVVRCSNQLKKDDTIRITFADGSARAIVKE